MPPANHKTFRWINLQTFLWLFHLDWEKEWPQSKKKISTKAHWQLLYFFSKIKRLVFCPCAREVTITCNCKYSILKEEVYTGFRVFQGCYTPATRNPCGIGEFPEWQAVRDLADISSIPYSTFNQITKQLRSNASSMLLRERLTTLVATPLHLAPWSVGGSLPYLEDMYNVLCLLWQYLGLHKLLDFP